MKKILVMLVLLMSAVTGMAQVKTVYFNEDDEVVTDSTEAVSYALIGRVTGDSVYTVKKFDADGYMLMTGAYKDDDLKVAHGNFVYYDWVEAISPLGNYVVPAGGKERFINLRGTFRNGLREGRWITYYQSGSIKDVVNYKQNRMNGEYRNFDYKGNLETQGNFIENKKEGTWITKGGRVIYQFKNDKVVSTIKKSKKQLEAERAAATQK
jgi:hypothetical protein